MVPNSVKSSFYQDYQLEESIVHRYKDDFVLLYLGDTHLRRGLLTAIESIPLLVDEIPNIKLVIVGKSTTDPVLKALIVHP